MRHATFTYDFGILGGLFGGATALEETKKLPFGVTHTWMRMPASCFGRGSGDSVECVVCSV